MSRFSGCFDLYDHIEGMGGWFDSNGNRVDIRDVATSPLHTDEMGDFLAFKERTGGVLRQHRRITVSELNRDYIKDNCPEFDYRVIEEDGKKDKTIYSYWGKDYTLREINKKGVFITVEIHFDDILDLIPYYAHTVSMCLYGDGSECVYISQEPYPMREYEELLDDGFIPSYPERYLKAMKEHVIEVFDKYLSNKTGEGEVIEVIDPSKLVCAPELNEYFYDLGHEVDGIRGISYEWDGDRSFHYAGVSFVNGKTIAFHINDVCTYLREDFKNGKVKVRYTPKGDK